MFIKIFLVVITTLILLHESYISINIYVFFSPLYDKLVYNNIIIEHENTYDLVLKNDSFDDKNSKYLIKMEIKII